MKKIPSLTELLDYGEEYPYSGLIYEDYFTPISPEKEQLDQDNNDR